MGTVRNEDMAKRYGVGEWSQPSGSTKPPRDEESHQLAVCTYLRERKDIVMWFHPMNGGLKSRTEAARYTRLGVHKGVPDIWIIKSASGFKGTVIEIKDPNGDCPTDEQEWWLSELSDEGWFVGEARGAHEAVVMIDHMYGVDRGALMRAIISLSRSPAGPMLAKAVG